MNFLGMLKAKKALKVFSLRNAIDIEQEDKDFTARTENRQSRWLN